MRISSVLNKGKGTTYSASLTPFTRYAYSLLIDQIETNNSSDLYGVGLKNIVSGIQRSRSFLCRNIGSSRPRASQCVGCHVDISNRCKRHGLRVCVQCAYTNLGHASSSNNRRCVAISTDEFFLFCWIRIIGFIIDFATRREIASTVRCTVFLWHGFDR